MRSTRVRLLVFLALSFMLYGCGGSGVHLTSIQITATTQSPAAGNSVQLSANGLYSDGTTKALTANTITWSSSNAAVAAVDANGNITTKAQGSATISATVGSTSSTIVISVGQAVVSSFSVSASSPALALGLGVTESLSGSLTDGSSATSPSFASCTWTSSNTAVATVSSASGGTSTVQSIAQGTATVTVACGSVTHQISVAVGPPVAASIYLLSSSVEFPLGSTAQIAVYLTMTDNHSSRVTSGVTWQSSNTAVATLAVQGDDSVVVTSVGQGETTISASYQTYSKSVLIKVDPPEISSIAVTPDGASIAVGATKQYKATATMTDKTSQDVTSASNWSSSDTTIATISASGLVTGVKAGTTNISATDGKEGSTVLTVTAASPTGPGTLDTTFGSGGLIITKIEGAIRAVAIQPANQKIVAVGNANSQIQLLRYNTDGSLDTSFGTNGISTTTVTGTDTAFRLALQGDGKILVLGYGYPGTVFLARFNTDGSSDSSFGSDGLVKVSVGTYDFYYGLAIQPADGKILVGGEKGAETVHMIRFNTDGSVDGTFVSTPVFDDSMAYYPMVNSISVDASGNILAGGSGMFIVSAGKVANINFMVRYTPSGSLDISFGNGGSLLALDPGNSDVETSMLVDSSGNILLGGYSCGATGTAGSCAGPVEFQIGEYDSYGDLVTSFANGGWAVNAFGIDASQIGGLAFDSNQKIVAGGTAEISGNGENKAFAVARYNANGSLDTSFGTSGVTLTAFPITSYVYYPGSTANAVAIQADGKIVLAGSTACDWQYCSNRIQFALARYLP